jgi:hypothetical protein
MFQPLLIQIARELDRRSIPYMVIGGQAVLQYGEPRFTRDIDVTLGIGPDRTGEILDLAHSAGWKVLVDSPAEFVQKTFVLPCREVQSEIRIDFVFSFSPYESQAIQRAHRIQIEDQEDLIIHKIVAGRPRDTADVLSVFRKNPGLDQAYIRGWIEEFSKSLGQPFIQRYEEVLNELNS